ncbi:molybdopterin-dependent oxidoreductase [Notoacmeibacter sp. MSK16QG-6]|uniref:molybdopterin-dependent oxidoreductase n=1 Tax=Notoacmeibacter sp. MSK16QG-6 TaxID=2957982 RepID=UPI0020A1C083|nr:molybdopterin-dependent oxidoreductase [Notoacmeibacter sp. MSK16QG-6]MCP1199071.1 molybdopterin-dependent oxidoreductase [Notoacmeibacter sp. MSK16QG-6]
MKPSRLLIRLAGALVLFLASHAAIASEIGTPEGEPVLTVSGQIGQANQNGKAVFDKDMLEALPTKSFRTSTIWTEGSHTFTGVALNDFLKAVGADGKTINAIALNDYAVEIPVSDAIDNGPIIAYQMDGKAMSVRDKGPLWIVYPYDANADYRTEMIYSRSIWQLNRIEIE